MSDESTPQNNPNPNPAPNPNAGKGRSDQGPRQGAPNRGPREGGGREGGGRSGGPREGRPGGDRPGGDRPRGDRPGGDRGGDRGGNRGGDRGGDRPNFRSDFTPDIDLDQLLRDSLYLDNQAHVIVSRLRDLDTGTRSQLRRLYNAARRACRTKDAERQHEFVMFRARLAYTIARHSLRSLDPLEKLLLQVTRRNDARAYERFRDLFEAIIAYNE